MKISVIIPVRNEAGSIRGLLDGLLNQSLTPEEILITDGGSTDNTPAIVREYAQRHSNVHLFCEASALPGRGRNIAAANAAHEWLAFIDGGVEPARDWLAQLAECAARDAHTDVVYGAWEPVTDTLFKECAAIAYAFVPDRTTLKVMRAGYRLVVDATISVADGWGLSRTLALGRGPSLHSQDRRKRIQRRLRA